MLADFDAQQLYETIPNFHNTRSRIAVLMRHANEDPCGRADEVQDEVKRIKALTPIEIKTMALGAFTMTLEVAVRFLDDYITGDQYFKTNYRGHNLVRARCQIKLAEEMYDRMGEMNKIISEIAGMTF